ncbi:hypothetical protein ACJMK2_021804, partial [Sinanodonta woodiana]
DELSALTTTYPIIAQYLVLHIVDQRGQRLITERQAIQQKDSIRSLKLCLIMHKRNIQLC